MQEPDARADRTVGRVVVAALAVVITRPELDELHQVVLGADRHLESPDFRRREVVAQIRADGYLVHVAEERIQRHARRQVHRRGVGRVFQIAAQIAQLGARTQRRIASDVFQRMRPCGAQVHGQRVRRGFGTFEVHVAGHDADGPVAADAARVAQIDRHVVVAPLAQVLPPADLRQIDVVETAESRHGVVVELPLPVIGQGYLRRHLRENGRRGVVVYDVRPRQGRHGDAAHAERLGVGRRQGRFLRCGAERRGEQCHCGYQTFHTANIPEGGRQNENLSPDLSGTPSMCGKYSKKDASSTGAGGQTLGTVRPACDRASGPAAPDGPRRRHAKHDAVRLKSASGTPRRA